MASAVLLALAAGITLGARVGRRRRRPSRSAGRDRASTAAAQAASRHVPVPQEIRGVHVTMALASLPGKLQQYLAHAAA